MSPRKELEEPQHNFLKGLLQRFGAPIEGDPYAVPMADGTERTIVLGDGFVYADNEILERLRPVLDGTTLFQAPKDEVISPKRRYTSDTDLHAVFGNRIANALSRNGITTMDELREILQREDGELRFLSMDLLGGKSLEEVKRALGS